MIHSFFTDLPASFDIIFGFCLGLLAACGAAALKSSSNADHWLETHMPSDPTRDADDFPVNENPLNTTGNPRSGNGAIPPNVAEGSLQRSARGSRNVFTAQQLFRILK